ncbi:alpha/beta fold hydrolase [Rhodobacteraceae bacterium NNCM2]|nr:alpha/beta fold hydrolase [Coraliihabitans acroporae]
MSELDLGSGNALFYLYHEPARPAAPTFVFVNALTGSTDHWEAVIAPALREQGFGTLTYNFRGQAESRFAEGLELTDEVIISDLQTLLASLKPQKPILVGLSVGGLYAARAILGGSEVAGLVFLNTLREIGPRIAWVNDALPVITGHGGVPLLMDAIFPMLVGPDFLNKARANALTGEYAPTDPASGHANLMRNSPQTDWAPDWSQLSVPVLNIQGLMDRVFYDADVVARLLTQIPDTRLEEWAEYGHLLPLEAPEKLTESLARFGTELEAD